MVVVPAPQVTYIGWRDDTIIQLGFYSEIVLKFQHVTQLLSNGVYHGLTNYTDTTAFVGFS